MKEVEFDGIVYTVKKPTYKDLTEAQLYSSRVFNEALKNGAYLRPKLDDELRKQGLWNDDKAKRLLKVTEDILNETKELSKGSKGKYKKLSEARQAAIKVRQLRIEQTNLLMENRRLDVFTAESQAEQARFDCLVSLCVYLNQERVFKSIDDYLEKASEDWARECAKALNAILYPDQEKDWEMELPENKFLKQNNLINDDGRLVNKEGKLVDENMRLIDQEGNYIDKDGNTVDLEGEKVEEHYTDYENDLE